MTLAINDNSVDLSIYKGEIRRCPFCIPRRTGNKELDERNLLEAMSTTTACKYCFSNRFIAICTNCNGTGKFDGSTVWDGGKHPHTSTCNPCGGSGMFPARKPKDWVETETVAAVAKVVETAPVPV